MNSNVMKNCDIKDGDWLIVSDFSSDDQIVHNFNLCIALSHKLIKNALNIAFYNETKNLKSNIVKINKVFNPIVLNSLVLRSDQSIDDSIEFFDLKRFVRDYLSKTLTKTFNSL